MKSYLDLEKLKTELERTKKLVESMKSQGFNSNEITQLRFRLASLIGESARLLKSSEPEEYKEES